MAANWSALPLDLLALIAFKLEAVEDFIYFSVVCRSWNCASSSIKHQWRAKPVLPWLLLTENTKDNPNCARKICNLNNNKCYTLNLPETFGARCWGSPYGWVAVGKSDHTIQLINPITKANISFPSLESLLNLRENCGDGFLDYNNWCLTYFLTKLIVLKVSHGGRHEFVIVIIYDLNHYLAFARQGDQSWTPVSIRRRRKILKISDVVAMDDHVYVVYNDGAIAYWNVKEFYSMKAIRTMEYFPDKHNRDPFGYCKSLYLIPSGTDLLMVIRHKNNPMEINMGKPDYDYDEDFYTTTNFEVYKLDKKEKEWERIEDLGDETLFVGDNYSMSTFLAQDCCLQRNCIYFTDDESVEWRVVKDFGGYDMGIYDIKSDQVQPFYRGLDTRSSFCAPIFFIPQF